MGSMSLADRKNESHDNDDDDGDGESDNGDRVIVIGGDNNERSRKMGLLEGGDMIMGGSSAMG